MTYVATSTRAQGEKLLVPVKSSLIVRAGRRDEIVVVILEVVDVLHPQVDSILRAHVGLAGLVRPRERVRTGKGERGNTHSFIPRTILA